MKSQVLHTVWCDISGEAAGGIWHWSLVGVKGLIFSSTLVGDSRIPRPNPVTWNRHRGNTLFGRPGTPILSQQLLHTMTNPRLFWQLVVTFINVTTWPRYQCICRNINRAQGKQSLHSRWNFISTFTEFIWPSQWMLTNWSDDKNVFQRCLWNTCL